MKRKLLCIAILSMTIPAVSWSQVEESKSSRHGNVSEPISRQQLCYNGQDYHWPVDGSDIKNAACKTAYQKNYNKYKDYPEFSGADNVDKLIEQSNYPFLQKDEFAKLIPEPDYNDFDKVKQAIPDGQICSGGNIGTEKDSKKPYLYNDKSGIDEAAQWTASDVTLNDKGELNVIWHATAKHDPSFFEVYISNENYDASERPLKWSDLILLKKEENPTFEEDNYKLSVPVNNAKGKRVLFVRWQRIDPAGEGFYSCSDINIK